LTSAVIVDAVRTAGGRRHGMLSGWHPVDLAAEILQAVVTRNDVDPAQVDDVIMGCVIQVGAQAVNVGRNAVLAAGFPESVPATTVDRQCGSSQQAMHFAAQAVMAGQYDIVVAAGVEVMSLVPMGASVGHGVGLPFGPRMEARYASGGGLVPQGISAEMIAERWALTRDDLDRYALASQMRAAAAASGGRFDCEIVPVQARHRDKETGRVSAGDGLVTLDEGVRPDTTLEALARLKPSFRPDGMVTAGNSSQITDGASAVLIMSEQAAGDMGLVPRARFHSFAVVGSDPQLMLTGPIPATRRILERSGLGVTDVDLFEVNEAFAPVVLAWEAELHPDMSRVNVNGGAIALGHPLGASGTKLMATLLNELERRRGRYGLQVMCEGGGMANATLIERLG